MFTTAHHLSLHQARQVQSTHFHPNSLRSILILSFLSIPLPSNSSLFLRCSYQTLVCICLLPPFVLHAQPTLVSKYTKNSEHSNKHTMHNCAAQYLGPQSGAGPTDNTTTPPAVMSTVKHRESHRLATHASCNLATQHQIYPTLQSTSASILYKNPATQFNTDIHF